MLTKTSTSIMFFVLWFSMSNNLIADPQTSKDILTDSPTTLSPVTITSKVSSRPEDASPSNIKRSQFTTAIVDREPTDDVVMLTNNTDKVYYFTELSNLKGHKVTHRWEYRGKMMAEIAFDVKSDRWRVFSSKKINPDWTGEWSVVLIDENGTPLDVSKLDIVEASSN
ncbi:DUF2914 domain-containing protein [Kaarinaea lacus]